MAALPCKEGNQMDIRAAILTHAPVKSPYAESRPLSIETVQLDAPGRDEVLVRIAAAGLCHSDLSVINGDRPRPTPMVLGHEAAGIVEQCGEGVTDLQKGDHVVMVFVPSCGHCLPCAEGRPALCEPGVAANTEGTLLGGDRRIHHDGKDVHHHAGVSAFAEYAVVSRHSLVKVDRDLDLNHAALFGCAVLTGMGAVINTGKMQPGQTVAVVGLGGVGLSAVLAAVAGGAGEVIAIDVNEAKLEMAKSLGATQVFNSRDEGHVEAVRAVTSGGVDISIETAGVIPALESAMAVTRRGGHTITASLANPQAKISLTPVHLVVEERSLRGSFLGGGVPARDIPRYIKLFQQGKLPVDRLMTSTGPLEDINAAFDLLDRGETIRHVITMPGAAEQEE